MPTCSMRKKEAPRVWPAEIRVERRQDVLAILGVDAAEPAGVIHLGKDKGILAVPCRQVVAVHVLREDESVTERALDVYVPQSLLGVAPQPGTDEAGRIMTVFRRSRQGGVADRRVNQYVIGVHGSRVSHVDTRQIGVFSFLGLRLKGQILDADHGLVEAVEVRSRSGRQNAAGVAAGSV